MVTRTVANLRESGVKVNSPVSLKAAGMKLAVAANAAARAGNKEQAESLAHQSQATLQTALTLSRVSPKLLEETASNVLIDSGATRPTSAIEVPPVTIQVPAPILSKSGPTTGVPEAPALIAPGADGKLTTQDVQVGGSIGTGTILGVAVIAAVAFVAWKKLSK